jgi:parvulin-like peptidyl-prolyl isomerase
MSALKIGDRQLNGDQIVSALVQYKLLEPLVAQVLLDEVIEQIPISNQELFRALGGAADAALPENLQEFAEQWCQKNNVTPAYFNSVVLRELRVEKFKQINFGEQVESEFLRTKAEFDQVEYWLLRVTDKSLAQELYFHLRDDGADFERLARQYSLGNERHSGGRIGPVSLSTLPAPIATLFRGDPVGEVHSPITVGDRFWIVRLERLVSARLTDSLRTNLINQLYDRWLRSRVNALMSQPGAIRMQSA